MDIKENLYHDLMKVDWIKTKCQKYTYAQNLYAAMCNNRFFKNDQEWTCSWRSSGGIVAELRNKNEDYLDFYCSGMWKGDAYVPEGTVTSEINNDLLNLGWVVKPYEPKLEPGIYRNNWK